MSILSDREIRELCDYPFMVDFTQTHPAGMKRTFSEPTFLTVEKLIEKEKVEWSPYVPKMIAGTHREMTLAEKETWVVDNPRMITPYSSKQVKTDENGNKCISWGESSYGYDIRLADEFKIFTNINTSKIDPKNFDERSFVNFKGDVCIIPPNSFVLARSLEYFKIPNDITGIVFNKSTYARCGILCFTTIIESAWEGELTLEYTNTSSLPAILYANEGAAQIVFLKGDQACDVSYAVGNRKYQGQRGITLPKV